MNQTEHLHNQNVSEDPQQLQGETVSSIQKRLREEKNNSSSRITLGEMMREDKVGSLDKDKLENQDKNNRSNLPDRPSPEQKEVSESPEVDRELQSGDGTEKLGNLSKIIDIGDPVIPDSVGSELDADGSWFFADFSQDDEEKLHIIYKAPDGTVTGDDEVTWEQVTPRYENAQEFTTALKRLRERYEEETAKEDGSEAYQKHLAKLIQQVSHFAKIFYNKHKDQADNA